jgi:hypothetical protein
MDLPFGYFEDDRDDFKMFCNDCREWTVPKLKHVNENTDADGNRGMMVTYAECPECGTDLETKPDWECKFCGSVKYKDLGVNDEIFRTCTDCNRTSI